MGLGSSWSYCCCCCPVQHSQVLFFFLLLAVSWALPFFPKALLCLFYKAFFFPPAPMVPLLQRLAVPEAASQQALPCMWPLVCLAALSWQVHLFQRTPWLLLMPLLQRLPCLLLLSLFQNLFWGCLGFCCFLFFRVCLCWLGFCCPFFRGFHFGFCCLFCRGFHFSFCCLFCRGFQFLFFFCLFYRGFQFCKLNFCLFCRGFFF